MPATVTRPRTGTCEICGYTFQIPPNVADRWKMYCGRQCRDKAIYLRRKANRRVPVEVADEVVDAARVPPVEPTRARPGSGTKIEVLAARVAAGLTLWHDEDAGFV